MPSQTITLTTNADDGGESGGVWNASANPIYVDSAVAEAGGWSFVIATAIPAGSTVTKAYFSVISDIDVNTSSTVNLQTESVDPGTAAIWSSTHLPTGATALRARNVGPVTWATATRYFGEANLQPQNLFQDLQDLVNTYGGLAVGERVNIFIEEVSGSGYTSFTDSSLTANDPTLFIEWTAPGGGGGRLVQGCLVNGLLLGSLAR